MFAGHQIDGATAEEMVGRFRADRAREFDEFATRGDGLLAEIEKETVAGKFSFAELEEIEDDFEKLTLWLGKIEARDFFPDKRCDDAAALLETCRNATATFAQNIYDHEGAANDPSD